MDYSKQAPPPDYSQSVSGPQTQTTQAGYAPVSQQGGYPPMSQQGGYPPASQQGGYPATSQQMGYPPQPYQQQPPPPPMMQQPTPAVQVVTVPVVNTFREVPLNTQCPHCHQNVCTRVEYENGLLMWLIVGAICFFGIPFFLFLGCCLIPLCIPSLKDVGHYCPSCNQKLGTYQRVR